MDPTMRIGSGRPIPFLYHSAGRAARQYRARPCCPFNDCSITSKKKSSNPDLSV